MKGTTLEFRRSDMACLRSLGISSSVAAAAFAIAALSSSSSSSSPKPNFASPSFSSLKLKPATRQSFEVTYFSPAQSALSMGSQTSERIQADEVSVASIPNLQTSGPLPELLTEFMVDMKCEGCVSAVKSKLLAVDGVKGVDVDLSNQVVRVLGSSFVKSMSDALDQTGRKARLIGQGVPEDFLVSAAVAEFKGPIIFGVVRLAQINMELARIEANFSGLSAGKHGWSINEFGDLTRGAASTGKTFNPTNEVSCEELGDLGTLDVNESGEAYFSGVKERLRVAELIGRSIAVYETEDKSDSGIAAAVVARSAGVGENYKKICTCDGTIIWESSPNDFVVK